MVIHLSYFISPTAIRRPIIPAAFIAMSAGIMTVVVYAVNTMISGWSLPYVFEEVFKALQSIAYFTTFFCIGWIGCIAWFASLFHVTPGIVSKRLTGSRVVTVFKESFLGKLIFKATARFLLALRKVAFANYGSISTGAFAVPMSFTGCTVLRSGNNSKAVKFLTGNVNKHNNLHDYLSTAYNITINKIKNKGNKDAS